MKRNISAWMVIAAALFMVIYAGCTSNRSTDGQQSVVQTAEGILRSTTYVGADRCGGCHTELHTGWVGSAHTKKLRDGSLEGNYINDGNNTGRADFFDTQWLDLETAESADGNFAVFGANAPKLGSDFSGAYVAIGGTKYYIIYTLGGGPDQDPIAGDTNGDGLILNGEAQWKQRYITKIGNSVYVLPVQFNAATEGYVTYHPEDWYNVDGDNSPISIATSRSYDRRCAGCHVTGLQMAVSADNEWTMSFSDISVSCEACHGPGGQHVVTPTKDNIVNPATMMASADMNGDAVIDQIDNLIIRNMVCFSCHSRGDGKFADGAGKKTGYPSRDDGNGNMLTFVPGVDWNDYYDITSSSGKYWGTPPINEDGEFEPTADFIASSGHHQQQQDFAAGPHAADKSYDHECFTCHDMHGTENKHQVTTSIVDGGITVTTANDDNTLCLACHAGHGDFASLSVANVNVNDPAVVGPVVLEHMKYAIMGGTTYDPAGTGVGRCSKCHMPKTAKSATRNDHGIGDIHSHTFEIIWPSMNEKDDALASLPNACNGCHYEGGVEDGTEEIMDWAQSAHGDENGEAWIHYDWDGHDEDPPATNRQSCQRCHTATGARNFMADPAGYDPANNEYDLKVGENQVLLCLACHEGTGGTLNTPGPITVEYSDAPFTYPDVAGSNVCLSCHTGRESGDSIIASTDDFSDKRFVNSHYLTAGGQVFTATGFEYNGRSYENVSFYAHDKLGRGTTGIAAIDDNYMNGPCVTCHFSSNDGSHTLSPLTQYAAGDVSLNPVCVNCHDSRGEGTNSGVEWLQDTWQARYNAAIEALGAQLALAGFPYLGHYPYFSPTDNNWLSAGDTDTTGDTTGKNNMGAAFNYNLLAHDPGGVAHNRYYTRRLIYDAIDWLDNNVMDYSVGATLEALDASATYKDNAITYLIKDGTATGDENERY